MEIGRVVAAERVRRGRFRAVAITAAAASLLATGLVAMGTSQASGAEPRWRGDYQTGDLSQWSGVHTARPDAITVVTSPARPGLKYAARVIVRPGDRTFGQTGEERAEVAAARANSGSTEGMETWYAWSSHFPAGFQVDDGNWLAFTQWHQDYNSCPPNMGFFVSAGPSPRIRLGVRGGWLDKATCKPERGTTYDLGPLPTGGWTDFALRVKWSAGAGQIEAKVNGKTVLASTNHPTLFTGQGAYLKQGVYRGNSARTHIVHHAGTRQGPTEASVALPSGTTAPPPVATPRPTVVPPATAGSVDNAAFAYTGTWNTSTGGGTFRSGDRYSSVPGSTYSLSFTGTRVAVRASKDPRHGIAAISVDGNREYFVDLYSATRADQVPVFSRSLRAGNHTVRVRVTGWQNAKAGGSIVNADRVDVTR